MTATKAKPVRLTTEHTRSGTTRPSRVATVQTVPAQLAFPVTRMMLSQIAHAS
jgi:hypothetical protein